MNDVATLLSILLPSGAIVAVVLGLWIDKKMDKKFAAQNERLEQKFATKEQVEALRREHILSLMLLAEKLRVPVKDFEDLLKKEK